MAIPEHTTYRKAMRRYIAMRKLFAHSKRETWNQYQRHGWSRNLVPTQWIRELQR